MNPITVYGLEDCVFPVKAINATPDWYTHLKTYDVTGTARACPSIISTMRQGIVILCPADVEFAVMSGKLVGVNEHNRYISQHHFSQLGRRKENSVLVKFCTHAMMKLPKGVSGYCTDFDPLEESYKVFGGVFPDADHPMPINLNTIFPPGRYKIAKGQPIGRILFQNVPDLSLETKILSGSELVDMNEEYLTEAYVVEDGKRIANLKKYDLKNGVI